MYLARHRPVSGPGRSQCARFACNRRPRYASRIGGRCPGHVSANHHLGSSRNRINVRSFVNHPD